MSGEFSHYPDNEPIPASTEVAPEVAEAFRRQVERLSYSMANVAGEKYGGQWYRDSVTNNIVFVAREERPPGDRGQTNICYATIYEEPIDQPNGTSSQISTIFRLDLARPETSTVETDLRAYSNKTHREVFHPDNVQSLPDPNDQDIGLLQRHRRTRDREEKMAKQRKAGIHPSQLPPVGTIGQEFADIVPVLSRLEEGERVEQEVVKNRPVRIDYEEDE